MRCFGRLNNPFRVLNSNFMCLFVLVASCRISVWGAQTHVGAEGLRSRSALILVLVHRFGAWGLSAALGLSCSMACGILSPWLGFEPVSPALEGRILAMTAREVPCLILNKNYFQYEVSSLPGASTEYHNPYQLACIFFSYQKLNICFFRFLNKCLILNCALTSLKGKTIPKILIL